MLFRASLRELTGHPLRTAFAVLGVAVSTAMLLDMLMLGSGLEASFEELLRGRGYELRVTVPGTLPFDTEATVARAGSLRDSLASDPAVAGVAPVLAANLLVRENGERGRGEEETRVFAMGVDFGEQGVLRMLEGRVASGDREVVLGRRTADELGAGPGDSLRLAAPRVLGRPTAATGAFRVTGIAEFLYASREERPVALSLGAVGALTGRRDRASLFMVRLAPGADADRAAARLSERFPRVDVSSVAELVEEAGDRLAYFRQLAYILGTVSMVVTVLLVGTLMAVSVSERYGTIAALRAVGVSRRSVVSALVLESVALCAVAGALGLALGAGTARYLETILAGFPGIPEAVRFFVLRPGHLATGYGALLAAGAVAAALPGWRAATLDIATTLHREEP